MLRENRQKKAAPEILRNKAQYKYAQRDKSRLQSPQRQRVGWSRAELGRSRADAKTKFG